MLHFSIQKKNWTPKKKSFVTFSQYPKPTTKKPNILLHFSIQKVKWTTFFFFFVTFSQYRKKVGYISLYQLIKPKPNICVLWHILNTEYSCYISQYQSPKTKNSKNKFLLHFLNTGTKTKYGVFLLYFSIQKAKWTPKKIILLHFLNTPNRQPKFWFFLLHFSIQKTKWTPKKKKFVTFSQYRNRQPKNKKVCYISLYKNQNRQKFVTFLYTQTQKKNRKIEKSKKHVYVTFSQYPNRQPKFGFFCYISLYKKQNGQPKKIILLHFLNTETTTKKYLFLLHFSIQTTKRTPKKIFCYIFSIPRPTPTFLFFCYISLYKKENGHQKLFFLLHFLNTKIDNQNFYFFVTFLYTKSKTDNETHCFCYIFSIPKPKPKKKVFCYISLYKNQNRPEKYCFCYIFSIPNRKTRKYTFCYIFSILIPKTQIWVFFVTFLYTKSKTDNPKNKSLLHFAQYRDQD